MVGTRASARNGKDSGPSSSQNKSSPSAGSKRKADNSTTSKSKLGKNGNEKEQTTIEASMPSEEAENESKDVEMKDAAGAEPGAKPAQVSNGSNENTEVDAVTEREADIRDQEPMNQENEDGGPASEEEKKTNGDAAKESAKDEKDEKPEKSALDSIMNNAAGKGKDEEKNVTEEGTGSKVSQADNAVEDSSKREKSTPSSILEKGTIYFFFRGRVGINEPSEVNEIARSYIVLRPIPHGAKLSDGPIGDAKNVCMLSLPKKVLPVSPKDRFMVFVEKANATLEDVKQQLSSSDYTTKTVRHPFQAILPPFVSLYKLQDPHIEYISRIYFAPPTYALRYWC